MKILSLDCSAGPASAAVTENGKILASAYVNIKLTHSQTLLPMIENALNSAMLKFDDIEGIAVNCGPGSFTGIRIGIAAAKGLAAPKNLPCAAVSTLYSMAYNFVDTDCIICAVMDARCNQVYNAIFDIKNGKITRLCEDRAILCEDLAQELKKVSQNKNKCVIIVGDGTEVFYSFVKDIDGIKKSSENNRYQNAESVGIAAAEIFKSGKAVSPQELLPTYLRLPQAERELKKKKEVNL
ncbi:MAG: tRNA (adenosine(37)-N6)-threonylcarbamoyltransferase complex dimerization subunit type 1 TsaB [Acutalibacteraceae bacterium]|nr:tRNA (adenosine(37)-N6)-threonylcarbamoyltransferase complex dimerization subunit type 1 TsaB [Acutalibacteraceae bacterium]